MEFKKGSICVAIQLKEVNKALEFAQKAILKGAEFIEYRVDYFSTILQDYPIIKDLITKTSVKTIITFRNPNEGGNLDVDETRRISTIIEIIKMQPSFIDIEASTPIHFLKQIFDCATQNGVGIIYSYHDFHHTPSLKEIESLAKGFEQKCPGLWKESRSTSSITTILKMIFFATQDSDNEVVLAFCEKNARLNHKIVTFCMGVLGIESRMRSIEYGGFFTFASIADATAPGQVSIDLFKQKSV